jgi:uncharacterized protein YraI
VKRLFFPSLIVLFVAAMLPMPAVQAQSDSDLIVLNDSTPGIDVVINPSPDTTGVIAIEVENASVTVVDAVGNLVFQTVDPNIEGIELRFAPNAGTHTLTLERLPGAVQAYARIAALAEMTVGSNTPELVSGPALAMDQEADFPLNASTPSAAVDFSVSDASYATVTASFPGTPVTAQLVSVTENRTLATLSGSLIDGIRFKVASGDYELVLLNNNTTQETVANVSVLPAPNTDFTTLVAEAEAANTTTMTDTATSAADTTVSSSVASGCSVTVAASSVNLRSGPGTGYSVLGYAFRGENLTVGGTNPASGWLLVGTDAGSGWMAGELGILNGSCNSLAVYDIPYLEAAAPVVTIQQSQVPVYSDAGGGDDYYENDDAYEGEYESASDDSHEGENEHSSSNQENEHESEHEDDD